ncbi:MAG: TspO/MBR family protein, partial [Atribacterota bacterium]
VFSGIVIEVCYRRNNKKGMIFLSSQLSPLLLSVLNIVGFVVVVMVNTLAVRLPLAGRTTGELADRYPNLFVPAGITFSVIWTAIYALLGMFVVYGLIQSLRMPTQAPSFIQKIGFLFLFTCIANVLWVFSWHYEVLPLSMIFMLVLLGTLGTIYVRLGIGQERVSVWEKYLVHLPMSLYFGWISIATIANIATLLVAYGWGRFGLSEEFWTVAVIGVGTLLALFVLFGRKDPFYALVVDWAILGILLKRMADTTTSTPKVIVASVICLVLISLCVTVQFARGRVYG